MHTFRGRCGYPHRAYGFVVRSSARTGDTGGCHGYVCAETTRLHAELARLIPADHLLAVTDLTPEEILLNELRQRGLSFASAESCTGGSIARRITAIPGSSSAFKGSVVAYCRTETSCRYHGVSFGKCFGYCPEDMLRAVGDHAHAVQLPACGLEHPGYCAGICVCDLTGKQFVATP